MTKPTRGPAQRVCNAFDDIRSGTLAATTSAAALAPARDDRAKIMEVIVQNDPSSASNVLIGNRSRQDFVLVAGASVTIPVCDLSRVYVKAVSTATVNWLTGV